MPHVKSEDGWLSVTEVLSLTIDKPFLRYWFGKYGTEKCGQIQRESQEIGTKFHSLIESYFEEGIAVSDTSQEKRMVDNFLRKFVDPYEVKPVSLEVTLKDEKLKLQGTFDAIIGTNKGMYLADWKTSNSLDKISVPLQLAAYAHLNKHVTNGVVVRIDKESDKVEVKWYENLSDYWPVFKAAMKLARWIKFGEV